MKDKHIIIQIDFNLFAKILKPQQLPVSFVTFSVLAEMFLHF